MPHELIFNQSHKNRNQWSIFYETISSVDLKIDNRNRTV